MSGQSFPVRRITLSHRAAAGLSEVLGGPRTRTRLARIRRDHAGEVVRENSRRDFMARRCWGGMPVEPDRPAAIGECLALIPPLLPNVSITSRAGVRARPRLQEQHENTRLSRSSRCHGAFG